jgi:uncharacterized protein YbjT (DUF2867 family)
MVWTPRLQGVDAVINCAGILQGGRGQSIEAVHHLGPRALFDACVGSGVRRVIQISAISADEAAGTAYASSKKSAEDALRSLDLEWVILRPSLVYARGSYGGTCSVRLRGVRCEVVRRRPPRHPRVAMIRGRERDGRSERAEPGLAAQAVAGD